MNIESITAVISVGISLVNSLAVAGIYLRYVQTASNIICTIRTDEKGEIEIDDPFL
ncbi:hypothetical protein [Methanospirillum sp.]